MAPIEFSNAQHIVYLVRRYIDGTIDFAQLQELDEWRKAAKENEVLFQQLIDREKQKVAIERMQAYNSAASLQKIKSLITASKEQQATYKTLWAKLLVAASVIAVIGISIFIYQRKPNIQQTASLKPQPTFVAAGSDKAVLILGNGKKVMLGRNVAATITIQSGIRATNSATGKLTYVQNTNASDANADIAFNTIETQRGGQYRIQLPDGTNVWLNAASSLTYPIAFTGPKREVELLGEAYFEVEHNARQPFIVKTAKQTVYDIGTSFNLNAYADEPNITTTLVKGAVDVTNGDKKVRLQPGQQAISHSNKIKVSIADIETTTAWKNGHLAFRHSDIQNVLRQISRWYNIDVEYQGRIPAITISGGVSRQADLSAILKMLQLSEVHFIQQGRKLIIKE